MIKNLRVGPHPYSLTPGSGRDLRLLREHRDTLALYITLDSQLDSGLPARLAASVPTVY